MLRQHLQIPESVTFLDSSNGLTETGGTNAYTITVGTDDAAVSASDLNSLNALTTVAVNINNVTSLTASDLSDLTTLNTNRAGLILIKSQQLLLLIMVEVPVS